MAARIDNQVRKDRSKKQTRRKEQGGRTGSPLRAEIEEMREQLALRQRKLEELRARVEAVRSAASNGAQDPHSGSEQQQEDAEVELVRRAAHILGTDEMVRWMKEPVPALSNRTPYSLMGTEQGRKDVERVLGQIEHGIF
jgi:uncharacterized protein (DUF2384 family)